MRRLACVAAVVVSVLACVPVASAGAPTISPFPNLDFTLSGYCAFDVYVHFDVNREQMIMFSNGDFLVTGRLTATLTTSIGTSLTINTSSPARGVFDANTDLTLYVMGPGFGPLPNLGEGLFLGNGLVIIGPTSVETHGHFVDLCALLA
jgi:hypothetical protein